MLVFNKFTLDNSYHNRESCCILFSKSYCRYSKQKDSRDTIDSQSNGKMLNPNSVLPLALDADSAVPVLLFPIGNNAAILVLSTIVTEVSCCIGTPSLDPDPPL